MTEKAFKELFAGIRDGDTDSFVTVYEELKQPVYTICLRITQSKEIAEDITHDVFVKLFCSPPDASVKNVRAWVFQVARNLSIDTLRKNTRTVGLETEIEAPDAYFRIHLQMDMESAFGRLPREEREILALHLGGDLSFREIAAIVGLSSPAVYRKYRKGLKRLQEDLKGGSL